MLVQASPGPTMRTRESGDCTRNSGGSCLSGSAVAMPTLDGSSIAMSACSSSGSTQPASPMDTQVCISKKQDRVKKRIIWGIEVAEELQWKDWELGKETTRNLVLKNLSLKIQKMKYRYQAPSPCALEPPNTGSLYKPS